MENPATAINLGDLVPQTLVGASSEPISVGNPAQFKINPLSKTDTTTQSVLQQLDQTACSACAEYNSLVNQLMQSGLNAISASSLIQQAASNYETQVQYPNNDFGNRLKLAASVTTSNLNPKIVYVTLGGFDTHGNQKATQNALLKELSDGLASFYTDMEGQGRANDTLIMTFSEFGRRVKENGSRGTDHGTAQPQFMIGGKVSPGLYGSYPSLSDLDSSGNLVYNIDFRQTYASVLEDWFGIDQDQVLESVFNKLTVI
jgi:uncharacterized protein (DUF1501 family)